jgi:hypothetical protein
VAHSLQTLFKTVFDVAYTNAVRPTLAVSIVVLAIGAVSCLFLERRQKATARADTLQARAEAASH